MLVIVSSPFVTCLTIYSVRCITQNILLTYKLSIDASSRTSFSHIKNKTHTHRDTIRQHHPDRSSPPRTSKNQCKRPRHTKYIFIFFYDFIVYSLDNSVGFFKTFHSFFMFHFILVLIFDCFYIPFSLFCSRTEYIRSAFHWLGPHCCVRCRILILRPIFFKLMRHVLKLRDFHEARINFQFTFQPPPPPLPFRLFFRVEQMTEAIISYDVFLL